PFLHTWSLAVEEQFYILLPIALYLLGVWRRAWLSRCIALACAVSFALGIRATLENSATSFYLLTPRAWELLFGSVLASCPAWGRAAPPWAREAISWGGLVAIGIAVALFDSTTVSPGLPALLPCVGATAFIWANSAEGTTAGRMLARQPLVFIGQI